MKFDMVYIVSYDLRNGDSEDYSALYDVLDSFPGSIADSESTWLVVSNASVEKVFDQISSALHRGDILFVSALHPGQNYMASKKKTRLWLETCLENGYF